jgi:dTDP-4-dehydrorhamnose reductase
LVAAGAPAGVYHATNAGRATWYELAREVFSLLQADPARLRPTTTERFPRPAPRPAFSVLGHEKWAKVGLAPMREWPLALRDALPAVRDQVLRSSV